MARKKANIHYIYKTICNVTGKWYIGMHSTTKLDDGYMGSGTILRHSIRKHGVENHTKEILEYHPTREELVFREIEIVNKELISDGKCMNLKEGGKGGFLSEEHRIKFLVGGNKALKYKIDNDEEYRRNFSLKRSEINIKAHAEGKLNGFKKSCRFKGKIHSVESKQKTSETKKGTGIGETNSQFGTCWITKDGSNKKIKKEEIDTYQLDGWIRGRK